jgi:hypothetical protein
MLNIKKIFIGTSFSQSRFEDFPASDCKQWYRLALNKKNYLMESKNGDSFTLIMN